MNSILFAFSVDDVAMEGYSSENHLERLLNFCRSEGMTATFFTVPRSGGAEISPGSGYARLLRRAIEEGHEIAQHGLEHDRFEVGITPDFILSLPHEAPARKNLEENRARIEKNLSLLKIRERIAAGREILEKAVSVNVSGFRAPCLQFCPAMFRALAEEKFLYDSSKHLQRAGWDLNRNGAVIPESIKRVKFESMQEPGFVELPLTADYTWYLGPDKFNEALKLAKHDFRACAAEGIPFVPLSHVSPIQEGGKGCGFELYRRLLDYARSAARGTGLELVMCSLSEAANRFKPRG